MKIFSFFFWACILQRIDLNLGTILVVRPVPDCISVNEFNKATKILCENKTNSTLWKQIVDCHTPITEEYLRKSGAAICPKPQLVDPSDASKSIQEIFLNFCTLGTGPSFINRFMGEHCYVYGGRVGSVTVLPHRRQAARSKKIYGDDINCNIGKCILGMGLDL